MEIKMKEDSLMKKMFKIRNTIPGKFKAIEVRNGAEK